jgi:hypothetical protein
LEGRVVDFDEAVGLGEIESSAGPGGSVGLGGSAGPGGSAGVSRYRFHCTQIAGGSRTVAVGTLVSFGLLAGRDGHWEAADVRPVDH